MSIVAPTALNEQVASIEQYQDETITPTTTIKQPSSFKKGDSPLKTVRVTNGLYDLELSNKSGGSFSKYQLFNYVDHEDRLVSLISTDNTNNMVLSFISIDGDKVILDINWNLQENISSLNVERGKQALTFYTTHLGQEITKTYTFYPDSYSIDVDISFSSPSKFISRNQYSLSWSGGLPPTEKNVKNDYMFFEGYACLLYTSPSPRD